MDYKKWDIVQVSHELLGLPSRWPDQFGVVISSNALLDEADRYWILQVPVPAPDEPAKSDIVIPERAALIPTDKFIVRTHTIFAVHKDDLEGPAISSLPAKYYRETMNWVNTFLPRGGFRVPGM